MNTAVKSIVLKGFDQEFELTKAQMIVGRSESCDIVLDHPSVSFYHALIHVGADGDISIVDMKSVNGVFVGASKIDKETAVEVGDQLTIGKINFHIFESVSDIAIFDQDMVVEKQKEEEVHAVPACHNEDLVFIDDEYCNIKFDDADHKIKSTKLFKELKVSKEDYVDIDAMEAEFDIDANKETMNAVEITTTINGNILEQRAFSRKFTKIFAGNKNTGNTLLVDLIKEKKLPFLDLSSKGITLHPLPGFEQNKTELSFDSDEEIILSSGNFQIFIKNAQVTKKLVNVPLFYRNREFYKQTAIIFLSIFAPFLTLLLVNPDIFKPKEEKKLAIIYKKPTKSKVDKKKHASEKVTDTKKNTGHKKLTKNPEKISRRKVGQKKKAPAKTKVVKEVKQNTASTKPVKAVAKKTAPTKATKAPTKAYKFKFAGNTKSMFKNSVKNVTAASESSSALPSSSSSAIAASASKVSGTSSGQVGNLGSDSSGADNSFGSKGLSSRSGRDSSYIQTKTVVLGSMDPELLRKILRRYIPQFKHCYQEELTYNSESIKGIIDLNFKIQPSGQVSGIDIRAKDKRFSKRGINCMEKVLGLIAFPKPKGGGTVAVRQPLNLFSDKDS